MIDKEWLDEYPDEVLPLVLAKIDEQEKELRKAKKELIEVIRDSDKYSDLWMRVACRELSQEAYKKAIHPVEKNLRRLKMLIPSFEQLGFTEDELRVAREFPLDRLFPSELKKSGRYQVGICPFHQEKTPSFRVYDNNTYYCFGCNAGGDAIEFQMKLSDCTFVEAVKSLIQV